jgi:hypothetical protein
MLICTILDMDDSAPPRLRINPGGTLTPGEVVGRDPFLVVAWGAIERQSLLITAERRMGKTSVLLKLEAEPPARTLVIRRSLQGITSPDEFIRMLVADVEKAIPGLIKKSLGTRFAKAGIKSVGSSPLSVEFAPTSERSWKDVASETFAALDGEVDETVVFLWDELPQMIADIRDHHGHLIAREMLDVLRAARESHPSVRMVLSGSLGIHHVVADLRAKGGMWVPTHDMRSVDLPALSDEDACYLAAELLRNEEIVCDDLDLVAATIVAEVDRIPYYVHQTALHLQNAQRGGDCASADAVAVRRIVEDAITDPLDPWELGHYVARTPVYYGEDAETVNTILDTVALAPEPLSAATIRERLAAFAPPPSPERVQELLDLLCKDYYLCARPDYTFLRSLVRRAWIARRPSTR